MTARLAMRSVLFILYGGPSLRSGGASARREPPLERVLPCRHLETGRRELAIRQRAERRTGGGKARLGRRDRLQARRHAEQPRHFAEIGRASWRERRQI